MLTYTYNIIPKRLIVFASDLLFTLIALVIVLKMNSPSMFHSMTTLMQNLDQLFYVLLIQAIAYWLFGLYRGVWRFASLPDLIRIIKACLTGSFALALCNLFFDTSDVLPLSSFFLFCVLSIVMLSGSRISYRWFKDNRKFLNSGTRVLVIGAGTAGESIVRELKRKSSQSLLPIGLIDDDPEKLGLEIHGIRVLGNTSQLADIVASKTAELILIAIPTANSAQMRRVVNLCEETKIPYRTLPNLNDIASGKASITHIREVSVEDLLSRDPIQFDRRALHAHIGKKKILITGAGGSIGSELCRKIAECTPDCLILIEHSEFNLFQIQKELQQTFPDLVLYNYLVSITHREIINDIMRKHTPDYVFHAAAYKHVPLLEEQIKIAIENNIIGTQTVAQAAIDNQVKKFILVSTDKAVNPNNVMGATKRCAEIICQCMNQKSETRFITVRFGNVLGSTGSVVPLFKEQIVNGGPITITHPDMIRYFMTIEEAAQLIIQTIIIEKPSDLYILDMGEPVKIQYLAEQMIKLSGHIPHTDIKITYTGVRPGEKINEELFYATEQVAHSDHDKILKVCIPPIHAKNYLKRVSLLKEAFLSNDENIKTHLFNLANVLNQPSENADNEEVHKNIQTVNVKQMPLAMEYLQ